MPVLSSVLSFTPSIIKSFNPKKLVTLVETTPRGFHTEAAKAAEGAKSKITVQTFSERAFLLCGNTVCKRVNVHEKSAEECANAIKAILVLLQLHVSIPIYTESLQFAVEAFRNITEGKIPVLLSALLIAAVSTPFSLTYI